MAKRKHTRGDPKPKPVTPHIVEAREPDPLPEDTYGAKRWADLQASHYVWYPDRKVAIFDEGQASEAIAEP